MTITTYSPAYFDFLSRWITSPDLLFQFAGTEFSYPITEEALAFGEIIPQENQIPRIGRLLIGNPADRGKGYGTAFIHLLLAECKEHFQTRTVELFVLEDNLPAISCYQKIGFQFLPAQTWEVSHNQQNFLLLKMAYNL